MLVSNVAILPRFTEFFFRRGRVRRQVPPLELQDNTVAVGHWIRLDDQSVPAVALFSVVDVPMRQIGHHEDGVFGVRWSTYLAAKGMCEEDLWPVIFV